MIKFIPRAGPQFLSFSLSYTGIVTWLISSFKLLTVFSFLFFCLSPIFFFSFFLKRLCISDNIWIIYKTVIGKKFSVFRYLYYYFFIFFNHKDLLIQVIFVIVKNCNFCDFIFCIIFTSLWFWELIRNIC